MIRKVIVAFIIVTGIILFRFYQSQGIQFCAGILFCALVFQCGHYAKYGRWIEF